MVLSGPSARSMARPIVPDCPSWRNRPGLSAAVELFSRQDEPMVPRSVEELAEEIREAVASHLLTVACAEHGLVAWLLLRQAGHPARLVFGCDLYPFAAHCWCETTDGRVIADFPDRCERFSPFCIFS